jgi:hypothetical protein
VINQRTLVFGWVGGLDCSLNAMPLARISVFMCLQPLDQQEQKTKRKEEKELRAK